MELSKTEIENLDRIKRLNIINSISGIKPGNLIGSKSSNNKTNLAIFSSVIHLGSHPPLLGFIVRPANKIRRDTYENILDKAGIYLKVEEEFSIKEEFEAEEIQADLTEDSPTKGSSFSGLSLKELDSQLVEAVANENYELAAKLRDEISKRS